MSRKNLNIYLLNGNLGGLNNYLREEFQDEKLVSKHLIKNSEMGSEIETGIIRVLKESLDPPPWIKYVNEISKKKAVNIPKKTSVKCVILLRVRAAVNSKVFALTFGNGDLLLNPDYIVSDFGLKLSKSLLTVDEISSIDSMSIDRKIFNTRKQSSTVLMAEKLSDYGTHNIVKKIYGSFKGATDDFQKPFFLGGSGGLQFTGEVDLLTELGPLLSNFGKAYDEYSDKSKKFVLADNLIPVAGKNEKIELDKMLGQKILDIIESPKFDKRSTSTLKISPQEIFDINDFNGFFITGLGYKSSQITSAFDIDEIDYLERFSRQLKNQKRNVQGILTKLKSDEILKKSVNHSENEKISSVYKAINFETQYKEKYYILISGKWYELDRDFYKQIKEDVDSIPSLSSVNGLEFIRFSKSLHKENKESSEGKYNEDFAAKASILMMDKVNYNIGAEKKREYGFKPNSVIELCDLFYHTPKTIQFIHVKRHAGGAAGTSHLLSQSLVSAQTFNNDKENVINYINKEITKNNIKSSKFSYMPLKDQQQQKQVVLAIIDENADSKIKNSKMLSLLEMISLRENMMILKSLGYDYYLNFIPSDK
ncbi:DUF6119 family protein [Planococcus rifietoensis]|uniref:DUF6119 family protein n=1 Tax=Planococcus rifietoensis TaxID=200991 RepID=UPI00385080AC